MSGHSKWSTIKRQKGKTDAARAKVFTKIGRELSVAVKLGGVDAASNPRLRDAIAKARAANMPNDIINRHINKDKQDSASYETIIYEGYGEDGVAVIVECLTDNKNRTAGEIRHIFDKYGAGLGASGCVSYMFETKGVIVVERVMDEETFLSLCMSYEVLDVVAEEDSFVVYTTPLEFANVREGLEKQFSLVNAQIERVCANRIELTEESLCKLYTMLDKFEDNDDVQNVYHNAS